MFIAQRNLLYFWREQEVKNCNYQNYQVQGKRKKPVDTCFIFLPSLVLGPEM